ncbi:MAG: molybdopterin-dependent oxidoreductase, partial [Candidatus Binatia bacterium]
LPSLDLGILETAKRLCVDNPVRQRVPISQLAEAMLNPETYGTDIRALYVLQGNPVAQHPNTNKTIRALTSERMEFIAVTDIFMSETAKYADILLPASTLLERAMVWEGSDVGFCYDPLLKHQSPKRHLAYSQRVVEPLGESKDDFEIVCELARKLGLEEHFPWIDAEDWIEDVLNMAREDPRFPWLKDVSTERLIREGVVEVDAPEQPISKEFSTPSGRIELYNETLLQLGYDPMPVWRELAESKTGSPELFAKYPLHFMTVHYKFSINSSYANQPEILELGENDLLMHPDDAHTRGIGDGDQVEVFNDRGRLTIRARVAEEIRPGVVRMGHAGWEKWGNTSLLTSDRLTAGYGENPTNNTCLVEVRRLEG